MCASTAESIVHRNKRAKRSTFVSTGWLAKSVLVNPIDWISLSERVATGGYVLEMQPIQVYLGLNRFPVLEMEGVDISLSKQSC